MHIKTKYMNEPEAEIIIKQYENNNNSAILIINHYGEKLMVATVNIPELSLSNDHVLIKNYSENARILDSLIKNNVISTTGTTIPTGHTYVHLCELKPQTEWKE